MDIRKLRTTHGLLQKELAFALGVDVMTVSRWERGLNTPGPISTKRLRRFLSPIAPTSIATHTPHVPLEALKRIVDLQANGGSIICRTTSKFLYSNAAAREAFANLGIENLEGRDESEVFLTMPGNKGNSSGVNSYSEILDKLGGTYLHDAGVVQVTVSEVLSDPGRVMLARAERVLLGHNPYREDGAD